MRLLALATALLSAATVQAQEEPEYRMEIGGGLGLLTYLGDLNGNLTKNMQPMFSAVGKYRYNPRMALAVTVGYGKLKGTMENAQTWYPETPKDLSFSHSVVDAGLRFEYNFWAYGTGREYRGARPLAPFITGGLGLTYANANHSTVIGGNLALGFGVKYKVADRLNLTAEWLIHFTGTDALDGVKDPYGIKSTGMFKNKDSYSVLRLSLSYDIWAKCKVCNNDRD